jgi:hypothetical protein
MIYSKWNGDGGYYPDMTCWPGGPPKKDKEKEREEEKKEEEKKEFIEEKEFKV